MPKFPSNYKIKSQQERVELTDSAREGKQFVGKFLDVLQSFIDAVEDQQTTREAYDKASWPYYHASLLGEKRAYKRIKEHLEKIYN